ncbi:hypothetical protein JCM19037_889 [Geomicrobium sp. JCM 19037]|uniref:right-handed parallel beta-helix repeat-containing protein n=1 Tax=Geomicrobium sp. JCM 19037 TaxID=1460634 RepID=UPI00045F297A|nr:right-handed parallel beta-helix repeat-containing protein [Geomicrobium sp. JCM 19037]GAK02641.1 hypothetical protein JCM19037_889 [Geomicrobium sp. JCM 19037]
MIVTTYADLLAALAAGIPVIIVANDLVATSTATVNYSVEIQGANPNITITRSSAFTGDVFFVTNSGQLTVNALVLDGQEVTSTTLVRALGPVVMGAVTLRNSTSSTRGAALLVQGTSAILNGVTIFNCFSPIEAGTIYVTVPNSSLTLTDCIISGNESGGNGGALFMNEFTNFQCTRTIFAQNVAGINGGAFFLNTDITAVITDCQFIDNTAADGGAIFINPRTSLTVSGSGFSNNVATLNGAGIYLNAESAATITTSTFRGNQAPFGGGVFTNLNSSLVLDSNRFEENQATSAGAGLFMNVDSAAATSNNTFENNQAPQGAAIFVNVVAVLQSNADILFSNQANGEGGGLFINSDASVSATNLQAAVNTASTGGAVFNNGGSLTLQNSEIFGNTASVQGGAIFNAGTLNFVGTSNFGPFGSNNAPLAPGIYNAGTLNGQDALFVPDGVFIESADNVVQLTAPLSPNAVIQLNESDYVAPDPANSPIVVGVATPSYPVLTQEDANRFIKPPAGFEDWQVALIDNQIVLVFNPMVGPFRITYIGVIGRNPNPNSYTADDLPIVLQDPEPVEGLQFIGWFDALGNQVTVIPEGTTGDLVLYARYNTVNPPDVSGTVILSSSISICFCNNDCPCESCE